MRPRFADAGRGANGFTLAEVLVIVVIIGIVAAVAIPYAVGTGDLQVISAASLLSNDLQYAQNVAITTQTPVIVTFSPSSESYALSNASGALIHPMTKGAYSVNFANSGELGDVKIVSASFGSAATVTFDELGAPSAAGVVRLQSGPHVYDVSVAAATGKVTVTPVSP